MRLEEVKDKLLKGKLEEMKEHHYRRGYVDAVLDFYNEAKKVERKVPNVINRMFGGK